VDCDDDDCTDLAACGGCHDDDGDGFLDHLCGGSDCDDIDDTVYPDAPELCDGLDNDCDEVIPDGEVDRDSDGVRECGGDCDDLDASRYPGAEERCNGIDDDCDGAVPYVEQDVDGDLVRACEGDCDDDDARVNPAMPELCNDDIDNNCSGEINEDCAVILRKGGCACSTSPTGGFGVALWLPVLGWVVTGRRRAGEASAAQV
ncbi:MAG: putative metal-binding motif-containing protein, partial [Deltaproteobacteria bacterium]|nr:putative metal-binding motif-containing protein [Deltaproteobacteria bacterium]